MNPQYRQTWLLNRSAYAEPCPQVEGEWGFPVGHHVPALAVEDVAVDGMDGQAFRREFFGLPGLAVDAPGEDGVMADEQEQALGWNGANFKNRAKGDHDEAFGVLCVDQVGVATGDGADFIRVWS